MKAQNDAQNPTLSTDAALNDAELSSVHGGIIQFDPPPRPQRPPFQDMRPWPEPTPRPRSKWDFVLAWARDSK